MITGTPDSRAFTAAAGRVAMPPEDDREEVSSAVYLLSFRCQDDATPHSAPPPAKAGRKSFATYAAAGLRLRRAVGPFNEALRLPSIWFRQSSADLRRARPQACPDAARPRFDYRLLPAIRRGLNSREEGLCSRGRCRRHDRRLAHATSSPRRHAV